METALPDGISALVGPCLVCLFFLNSSQDGFSVTLQPAGMNPVRPALVRYVYFDVVNFSQGRSIEAQTDILIHLNQVVAQAVSGIVTLSDQTIFLPTGDGVCVCLVNLIHPLDLDIRIALDVLDRLFLMRQEVLDHTRHYEVRVGLNENQDNLILDVRGSANVVGLGINTAQRIMSVAAPSRLMLGCTVFERLSQREAYRSWIRSVPAIVKHGQRLRCYEFFNPALKCFSGSKLRSSRLPAAGKKDAQCSNDLISLPMDKANRNRRSNRSPKPAPPSFEVQ